MRRRTLFSAVSAAAVAGPLRSQTSSTPVRLGVIGISFHAVVGGVVQQVLEDLGHGTEIVNGAHDQTFAAMARGDVDLLLTAWLPGTHAHLFAASRERVTRLASVYEGARLFWSVPAHVPADAVRSIADLSRPEVKQRMDPEIRSIGPTAGLSVRSAVAMRDYGLEPHGYRLVAGETSEWVTKFRRDHARQAWMVMPLWVPHFLNRTHAVRVLEDPRGSLGTADEASIVAGNHFLAAAPQPTLKVLQRLHLGLDAVTEMDLAVNVRGLSPRAAAREWMDAHPQHVRAWRT